MQSPLKSVGCYSKRNFLVKTTSKGFDGLSLHKLVKTVVNCVEGDRFWGDKQELNLGATQTACYTATKDISRIEKLTSKTDCFIIK